MTQQKETKRLTTILFVRNYPPDDPRPAAWSLFLTYDNDAEPYWDFQHAAGQIGPHNQRATMPR